MKNLKEKAQTGVSISFIAKIVTQIVQFSFGIILARLLTPSDYGLVGMLAIFIAISATFVDSGLGTAVIRKKSPSSTDYTTVFWFNMTISVIAYILLVVAAPLIASFYEDDRLIKLSRVLGIVVIINAFGSIQGKYLNKNLKFHDLAKIYIISFVSGSIIAVVLAWRGLGVWALVARAIIVALLLNGGWWLRSKWRPDFLFSKTSFKELFGFGSKLLLTSIFDTIFNNLYSLVIGKFFSAKSLGYFIRAKQFNDIPDHTIRNLSMTVFFPILSYIQDDDQRLIRAYKKILGLLAFTMFPIYAILASIAYPLIHILLTDKWMLAAPLLQIMCLLSVSYPFQSINENVLYIKGRSNYVLYMSLSRKAVIAILIIIFLRYGVKGLTWGLVIDSIIGVFITSFFSKRVMNFSLLNQIRDISGVFAITLLSFFVMIIQMRLIVNPLMQILIVPLTGISIYIYVSYLFKRPELFELIQFIKSNINKFKTK